MSDLDFRFSGRAEKEFKNKNNDEFFDPKPSGELLGEPEEAPVSEAVPQGVEENTDGVSEISVQSEQSNKSYEELSEKEPSADDGAEISEKTNAEEAGEITAESVTSENSEEIQVDENAALIISDANRHEESHNPADTILGGLAKTTEKEKYDFINLCVLAILVLLIGMTFIFMKQSSYDDSQKKKLSLETIKTGEYTSSISESYTKNMPLSKTMTQANVLLRKIFGKTELEFVKFTSTEPPDGPVDNDIGGDLSMNDDDPTESMSAAVTTTEITTSTEKIKQDFDVTVPEDDSVQSELFTGRPIKTTTSKTTTRLDVPKATDETTTGKVNLILPETY